jgi:anti-sigma B factor antagonist
VEHGVDHELADEETGGVDELRQAPFDQRPLGQMARRGRACRLGREGRSHQHGRYPAWAMGDDTVDEEGLAPPPALVPAAFRVERDGRVVIHVAGELDALTGGELATVLSDAIDSSPESVVVDLRDLAFVDSVGLSVLVTAHNRGAAAGVPVQIHNVPPASMQVLEITRLVEVLDLH